MPVKILCRTCVEAKATRHPGTSPTSVLPPRPACRIPFGPFADRLGDGSYYVILFADAYSSLLWFDTLPTLGVWFVALVLQIEAEKGSSHVVAELACDSAAMFKSSIEFGTYAEFKEGQRRCGAPIRTAVRWQWRCIAPEGPLSPLGPWVLCSHGSRDPGSCRRHLQSEV